jgi:succinyl-CoA synthetase alpha subunit
LKSLAIYLTEQSKIIIQGITGKIGSLQAQQALAYNTRLVGGCSPGKGGQKVCGIPVFDTVREAVEKTGANASLIFVPAAYAPTAAHEALDAGIGLVVVITEHIPVGESLLMRSHAKENGAILIGPNCPGLLSPGIGKMGIVPEQTTKPGKLGILSRSGTLAFEVTAGLTTAGLGQSTIVGIGGDPEPCISMLEVLSAFEQDGGTDAIVLIGEIGGNAEEKAAAYIERYVTKPVFVYIAGRHAPAGKKMGHAGAIIQGNTGTASSKITAFQNAKVPIVTSPIELPGLIQKQLNGHGG